MTAPVAPVAFFSAEAVNRTIDPMAAIKRVIDRNWYVMGEEVKAFESAFAAYCGVAHCVSLANGTDALELGLRAAGVQRGDTVIVVANAAFYSSTAVRLIGAIPHYVDVDALSLTLCTDALSTALQSVKPKAIVATHLYGQLCDIESIAALAKAHGIALVEDCAQSHGAQRGGRRAGSFGDIACFSFYPTKNLGALGDGGAVVSKDIGMATRVRALRQYGWGKKYCNDVPLGRNSRLDEMQAAVLVDKLPSLDASNEQRRAVARTYQAAFAGLPLQLPVSTSDDFVAHLYVVRTPQRDALRAKLTADGIATDVHYPVPDHLQSAYDSGFAEGSLPVTEAACRTVLSLPCYPGIADADVARVVASVRAFFAAATPA